MHEQVEPDDEESTMQRAGITRWLSILLLGFVAGAATVMLADPNTAETRVLLSADTATAGHSHDGSHEHAESTITYDDLPKATKAEVDQVIALWATKYPTGADAMKDGWFKATKSLYGIGAHYIKSATSFGGTAEFDMLNPNILLFDGEGLDAEFAGVSYVVGGTPEGFTGEYDPWHSHESVCSQGGTVTSLTEEGSSMWYSESECRAAGGRVIPLANDQMMHLWIGPDYIDGAPIFAHDHPKLFDGYQAKRDD